MDVFSARLVVSAILLECIFYSDCCIVRRFFAAAKMDMDKWLLEIGKDPYRLSMAPEKIQANFEVVMAAVKKDGSALQYAARHLQKDRRVLICLLYRSGSWDGHGLRRLPLLMY